MSARICSALAQARCRRRGHDDALVTIGLVGEVRLAVLECDRCGRRVTIPNRARARTLAESVASNIDVQLVETSALRELQLGHAVGASMSGLLDGGDA